jgi:hypothetical protein
MLRFRRLVLFFFFLLVATTSLSQQNDDSAQTSPLRIVTDTLPRMALREPYDVQLHAEGGAPPYQWSVVAGELPAGLHLDSAGRLTGAPTTAQPFTFTVAVRASSSNPPQEARHEFSVKVMSALKMVWTVEPHLAAGAISGAAEVGNDSPDELDLTFIVVAINEIGKAFALGYQHFKLPPEQSQKIDFGSSLPAGSYNVHADAVAEIPPRNVIRRVWLEIPARLVVK